MSLGRIGVRVVSLRRRQDVGMLRMMSLCGGEEKRRGGLRCGLGLGGL